MLGIIGIAAYEEAQKAKEEAENAAAQSCTKLYSIKINQDTRACFSQEEYNQYITDGGSDGFNSREEAIINAKREQEMREFREANPQISDYEFEHPIVSSTEFWVVLIVSVILCCVMSYGKNLNNDN